MKTFIGYFWIGIRYAKDKFSSHLCKGLTNMGLCPHLVGIICLHLWRFPAITCILHNFSQCWVFGSNDIGLFHFAKLQLSTRPTLYIKINITRASIVDIPRNFEM